VNRETGVESLLRGLAPQALGAVVRRYGRFADAEDAVQEALAAAAAQWPADGVPDNPLGWLLRVASRRMADLARSAGSRRRRENLAASSSREPSDPAPGRDDTLALFFMCCHPALSPVSAVALTLRALGGLTTREIAAAFLVPEATMAQRISRAKRTVAESGARFAVPDEGTYAERLALVLRWSTSSSTRATPRAPVPTWTAPTWRPRPSAWAACCTSCCLTNPRHPGCWR